MSQFGHGLCFAEEAFGHVAISCKLWFDNFDCDFAVQSEVGGEVNRSHTTFSDLAFDPAIQVVRDGLNGATVARGGAEARADGLRPTQTYYVIATSAGSGEQLGPYVISLARC